MSYALTAYSTSKRANSTAVPSGGEGFSVVLKGGCSVLNPVFLLRVGAFEYNMVQWNGRYYWVRDVVWERDDLARVSCTVDVLGSWRTQIMNTTAYVNYSTSSYNVHLNDDRLMTETYATRETWKGSPLAFLDAEGSYVLGVVGKANVRGSSGMTQVYSLTNDQASDLSVAFSEEGGIWEKIAQQFADIYGCLVFCRWVPMPVDSGQSGNISILNFNTGIVGSKIQNRYMNTGFNVVIPWYSEDFRRVEPYSVGYLFLPFVGVVDVALSAFSETNSIYVSTAIDRYTGDIIYKIGGDAYPVAVYSGNCAVEVPINSYQRDWKGVVQGGMSTIYNIVQSALGTTFAAMGGDTKQAAGQGIQGMVSSIGDFANTGMSYLSMNSGSKGGISGGAGLGMGLEPSITVVTHNTSQTPGAMAGVIGRPCGRTLKIGSLSGFVQCAEFKVAGEMTQPEKDKIEASMRGGVYLE